MSCCGATLVIIDSTPSVRAEIRATAEQLGMVVVGEGETSEDALTLHASLQPDVVAIDAELGPVDGVATVRELVARDTHTRILVCSAGAELKHIPALHALGVRLVGKPIDAVVLSFALQAACWHVARGILHTAATDAALPTAA